MSIQPIKQVKVSALLLAMASVAAPMLMFHQSSKATPLAPPLHLTQTPPRPLSPGVAPSLDAHYSYKATRDIQRAREKAFSVQYLLSQASSQPAAEFASLAQQTLGQAENSYAAGRFFTAEKQAKAANALYEAAKTLCEGKLGYVAGPRGPKAPGKSWYEAPYRAQERIARTEAAMNYYQVNNPTATNLLQRARQLAGATAPTNVVQTPTAYNLATLANYRASEHLANAALHLVEAQRGF